MDNEQFIKIMFAGFIAGILLGNLLYYLVRTFDSKSDDVAEKENEMKEDIIKNREKENFRTVQEFNYSNAVAVKINYDIKMHLRDIYKRFGFDEEQRCELEMNYDSESYKIVSALQQGIFKEISTIDIANKIFDIMKESNLMVLLPDELKRIIDTNINK